MDDREHRWMQDELPRTSNRIPDEAREHGCTHLAFENLTDIREQMAGVERFHAWTFRRVFRYVEYKAEMPAIEVEQVSPAYTSQRCSKCGFMRGALSAGRPRESRQCRRAAFRRSSTRGG
jgi:IS605 OrfB family transposase